MTETAIKFQIKNRWSGNVQYECELSAEVAGLSFGARLGFAVRSARASGADLRDAVLRGADLSGADLRGADLRDAVLRGADLSGADLRGADLRDAVLRGAVLRGADLRGADLSGADLSGADLSDADLRDADLRGADLRDAVLRGADLRDAVLRGADLRDAVNAPSATPESDAERLARWRENAERYRASRPDVPVVENLDSKILAAIKSDPKAALDMTSWHACETTHCRAGWAIHLAGKEGYALQEKYDPEIAGRMIYRASVGHVPDFFASTSVAMKDIKARAAEQALA